MNNTVPIVNKTILCTYRFVQREDFMCSYHKNKNKKEDRETQENSGQCQICLQPWRGDSATGAA